MLSQLLLLRFFQPCLPLFYNVLLLFIFLQNDNFLSFLWAILHVVRCSWDVAMQMPIQSILQYERSPIFSIFITLDLNYLLGIKQGLTF